VFIKIFEVLMEEAKVTSGLNETVERWRASLIKSIAVADLLNRNPVAHKWKAPYRSFVIREALLWRMVDLGRQIIVLVDCDGVLGARILLRCAIETTSVLVYLNQRTAAVIEGELSWPEFDRLTMQLLMGSRDQRTDFGAINIITMVDRANRDYGGLKIMYERISESVHPNYDGVTYGYSRVCPSEFETRFGNYCVENFGVEQEPAGVTRWNVWKVGLHQMLLASNPRRALHSVYRSDHL
jgi:hypothetical protein